MKQSLIVFLLFFVVLAMVLHVGCKKSDFGDLPDMSLVGVRWILESIQYSNRNMIMMEEQFSILLKQDNSVEMVVDCNLCGGNYGLGRNNTILFNYSTVVCTEVYCGDDSRGTEFHDALESASRYEIDGDRLRIYFNNESSHLNFIAEQTM